ncbi:MAG TPA: DEAD/DEAH box helicase [Bacteroidales bacterium]|nr:DEAD/DEAH box helicase [Bacteroidales bacterium]
MISFESMGLSPLILKAVSELKYEQPTPVQTKVIPVILNQTDDIVALAQTGTGKTAAFGLPLIQLIDTGTQAIQGLILAPTRELCLQITDDLLSFAQYIDSIRIVPVYGGASIETQIKALKNGAHIVVATPGRLIDLLNRKALHIGKVKYLVLDEADEMLNKGFASDIETILGKLPKERRTFLFSATMPAEIAAITHKYMNRPLEIIVGTKNTGAENVQHIYYVVHAKDKYLLLKRIIDYNPGLYGIVFCRTRKETQEIADKLMHDGYNADALHGDLSQSQRDFVMNRFRLRQLEVLVATDVAARGLDVDDLTHVIHYTLPDDTEVYTHRSGRTERTNKKNVSIALINLREKYRIRELEKSLQKKFSPAQPPTNREICEKQLFHLIDRIERVEVEHSDIEPYLPLIFKKLSWIDREELIKRLVSIEFNRFLEYYRNAKEIDMPTETTLPVTAKREKKKQNIVPNAEGYVRLFINAGKSSGLYPNDIISLVNSVYSGKRIKIGKIQLLDNFSFFEVPHDMAEELCNRLSHIIYEGKKLSVSLAESRGRKKSK